MTLPEDLLEILACPLCSGPLAEEADKNRLVCRACGVAFEIQDGIPDMLPENAKPLES